MTKGVLIFFHNMHPCLNDHYRSKWEFWKKKCIWSNEVDKIYIIDNDNHGFTKEDKEWLSKNFKSFEIIEGHGQTWEHDNKYLYYVEEDIILRLDEDTIIYRKGLVKEYFDMIENKYDLVAGFRVIGAINPGNNFVEKYYKKFPFLLKDYLFEMTSWFFFLKRSILHQLPDLDFAPSMVQSISTPIPFGTYIPELDYYVDKDMLYEHAGMAGIKIMNLCNKIHVIPNDNSVCFISSIQAGRDKNLGWYHIGSWKEALQLVQYASLKEIDGRYKEQFIDRPDRVSIFRPLAYLWIMDEQTGYLDKYGKDILKMVYEKEYTEDQWLRYISELKKFHPWIE